MLYQAKGKSLSLSEDGILYGFVNAVIPVGVNHESTAMRIEFKIYPIMTKDWYERHYIGIVNGIPYSGYNATNIDPIIKTLLNEAQNNLHRRGKEFDFTRWIEKCGPIIRAKRNHETNKYRYDAKNPDARRYHKSKMKQHQKPNADNEYIKASKHIYGNHVDFGEFSMPMTERTARYMDGNTTEGYRPLNPVFPVKSGKRK